MGKPIAVTHINSERLMIIGWSDQRRAYVPRSENAWRRRDLCRAVERLERIVCSKDWGPSEQRGQVV